MNSLMAIFITDPLLLEISVKAGKDSDLLLEAKDQGDYQDQCTGRNNELKTMV